MKKQMVIGALLITTVVQTSSVAQANNADVGSIVGGLIGGLVGNQFGRGSGKTALTIIGAIAGSSVGRQVGAEMDENDRRALSEAQTLSLRGRLNSDCDWDGGRYGSRTGARGRITSTREGYNQYTGEYCREYRSVIYLRDRTEETTGSACTRRDGSWYEVQNTQVRWSGFDGGYDGDHGFRRDHDRPGRYNPNPAPVRPVPPPPAPAQANRSASVQIASITRRSGGEWVRISLTRPVSVEQLEVQALSAGLKIHAALVYTVSGRSVAVREYNETPTFYAGDKAVSEKLNLGERVTTIDIRAEAMGGLANIQVNVLSSDDYPSLNVTRY